MWQCASIRPGITVLPAASMLRSADFASSGGPSRPDHIAAMRPSLTRIEVFVRGRSAMPSMTLPPTMSSVPFMAWDYCSAGLRKEVVAPTRAVGRTSEPDIIEFDHVPGHDLVAVRRRHVPEHALD